MASPEAERRLAAITNALGDAFESYEHPETGRPLKLTPDLAERILRRIVEGDFPETAAQAEGIHPATYYRWMRAGREGQPLFREFCEAVMCAGANAESEAVAQLRMSANDDPRLNQWWLERARSSRWGQKIRHVVDMQLEGALDALADEFADEPEIYLRCLEAIARAESEAQVGGGQGERRTH